MVTGGTLHEVFIFLDYIVDHEVMVHVASLNGT